MIRNVIFDFGGVLLDIDIPKTFRAFEELGYKNVNGMFTQASANELFLNLETGNISPGDFYQQLQQAGPPPVTKDALEAAWNSMLLSYRKNSLAFLIPLSKNYRLFLLSNTNQIHQEAFNKMLREETGYNSLDAFFSKTYYSHQVGLRKPDREIYEFVLQDAEIEAKDTLFIDDTPANLSTAEKLGMQTHLLLPGERIEHLKYWAT